MKSLDDDRGRDRARTAGVMPAGAFLALVGLVLCSLLLGGCAPQLNRIETSVQMNRDAIARMQAENLRLTQEVQSLGSLLRMDRDAGDESSAMRLAKLSQVASRLDQLLQKLDDNAEYMRALSARVDLLATRQGIPTLGEYKPPRKDAVSSVTLPEEGRSILAQAELDRNRGNVDLAADGFREFLAKHGNSEAADQALYWLGDIACSQGDHQQALERFEDLLQRFPASERAAPALYKGRSCLLALGRENEAWEWGGKLLTQFPQSSEAALLNEAEPSGK
jgi:TolA-binding protein